MLSVARNCLRPVTAPLTILFIKIELLCDFAETLEGRHFMGHSGTGLKLGVTIDF